MEKKKIIELVDRAYEQIDESLNKNSYDQIEYGVAIGLDYLLDIKRTLLAEEEVD